jgi:hypothetical protein
VRTAGGIELLLYVTYFCLAIAWKLICYVFNPLVVLFADDDGNLPRWLYWFQTHDSSLDQPEEWVAKHWNKWFLYRENDKLYCLKRYLRRVKWLYRNTGYAFRYNILGYDVNKNDWIIVHDDENISDVAGVTGWHFSYDALKPLWKRGWCFYLVRGYGRYCIRAYFGWKFYHKRNDKRIMLAMHFNPIMRFGRE